MWRYVSGAIAALFVMTAGTLLWSSFAGTRSLVGPPPAAANSPLGAVDVAAPLEASEKTREQRRFARYDANENGAVSRDEYLVSPQIICPARSGRRWQTLVRGICGKGGQEICERRP